MKVFEAIGEGVAKAERLGIRVSIAVIGEDGELIALYKTPGTYVFSPLIAYLKARTAAIFKRRSSPRGPRRTSPST
ncbi:hypothetical protein TUZN_1017 [Thermoproteus uzoniensis 768-20]|uniref:Roadblock/LAMTOR2 domain-containing protein n=1 Tax=Thermoproteus uzoniensis (strain 768-20) TaxID=999630 RepID=F2L6A2_THEU7|nr:heme-binding protein [Thermoproteus uzoniensis]AEA12498.1 hypothetical protein TUZN_1017 [Thermoproteus uzoniensis 768-20]